MKILIISAHLPNIRGGVADHTLHLAKALADLGNRVSVLTSSDERVIKKTGGIEVLASVGSWGIRGLPQVMKAVKRANPDCVLLQYVPYMYDRRGVPASAAMLSLWLRFRGFRLVTTFHEIASGIHPANPKSVLLSLIQRLIADLICRASSGIVITAEAYRRTISRFSAKISKIHVGSNILPVDVSEDEKRDLRMEIAPAGEAIITTFGTNPRRTEGIFGAIKRLNERGVPSKLLVLGGAPDDWIQAMNRKIRDEGIHKCVSFTGFLPSEDVFRRLVASDLFVILEEVFPGGQGGVSVKNTSLTAAFAAGLPVIANRGHMTEGDYLAHGENILLIDSLDEERIAAEIKNLIANPSLMKKLSLAASETYREKLLWRTLALQYSKTISQ